MRIHSFAPLLIAASLLAAVPAGATRLRVDINSEGRADMRTAGCENWRPSRGDMSQSSGGVTVSLRADGAGGFINLRGKKALGVPCDLAAGKTIHVIWEVTDTGTPRLRRYRRVVVEIE